MNNCNYNRLSGRTAAPDILSYHELRQVPFTVVPCQNEDDVKNAVLWSRQHNVPLRMNHGGGAEEERRSGDSMLELHLDPMNRITLDENARLLTIEGGVKNKELYEFLGARGYPFPGGGRSLEEVREHALGGGWGPSCRFLGLGGDALTEVRLINWNGEEIRASRKENPDLFWACKSAGNSFGAAVSMTFFLPAKVKNATLIEISYPLANQEKQSLFLQDWQGWLADGDERFTVAARLFNSAEAGLGILAKGIFFGPPEEAFSVISPLIDLGGVRYSIKQMAVSEAIGVMGDLYPPSQGFRGAGRYVLRDFNSCESLKLAGLIKDRPAWSDSCYLSLYSLGGRILDVSTEASSFYYRKARYIMQIGTEYHDRMCENAAWTADRLCYLKSVTKGPCTGTSCEECPCFSEEAFGLHGCRLRRIKEKYDPMCVFPFPKGIEL